MPNVLEVLVRVNAAVDGGLNRASAAINGFAANIAARTRTMNEFNQKIRNGDAALRAWGSQIAALVSAGALRQFARQAEEAEAAQQRLLGTLGRFGEARSIGTLNAQASALERVTKFSDEAISDVQRLLVTFGLTAREAEGLTELVLDLAQETGQSAEGAALLIGRILKGDEEELGRYNVVLDKTKPRLVAVTEAIRGFAGGAARAAIANREAHSAQVDLGNSAERVGAAVLRLQRALAIELAPAVVRLAENVEALVERMGPFIPALASGAVGLGKVLAAVVALSLAKRGLLALVNPLRSFFVFLTGLSFVEFNKWTRELGLLSTFKVSDALGKLGVTLSAVGAAVAGFQIGTFISKLRIGDFTITDILARWVNAFGLWVDFTVDSAERAWVGLKFGFLERLKEAEAKILEFAFAAAAHLNMVLPEKLQIDLAAISRAIAEVRTETAGLDAEKAAALAEIEKRFQEKLNLRNTADQFIVATSAGARERNAQAVGEAEIQRERQQQRSREQREAAEKARVAAAELAQKRALFDLETAILEAQADGNQALVARLTRERDELRLRAELLANAKDDAQTHLETVEAIEARLNVEQEIRARARQRQADERELANALAANDAQRALVEADRLLTAEEKNRRVIDLLNEQNLLIAERIALLEAQLALGVDEQTERDLRDKIDQLRAQQTRNTGDAAGRRPLSVREQIGADLARVVDEWGTRAERIAAVFTGPIRAGLQAARDGMQQLLGTTDHWQQKLGLIGGAVMGAITSAISDMFAQWIASRIKAAATDKALTLAQGAVEYAAKLPGALLSSISSFGAAAIIGVAALTAALASFASGGLVSGAGGPEDDRILARLSNGEFIVRAAAVQQFGPSFLAGINRGVLDLSALPSQLAAGLAQPGSAASADTRAGAAPAREEARPLNVQVGFLNVRSELRRFMQEEGAKFVFDYQTKRTRRV